MKKRLQNLGVERMHLIDHGWATSLYLLDPNGIMVEFCVTTDAASFAQTEEEALVSCGSRSSRSRRRRARPSAANRVCRHKGDFEALWANLGSSDN
jgi:hypothetical protein